MTGFGKTRIKRLLTAGAAVFCAAALSGCGASVAVRGYTEDGIRYNSYTVSFSAELVGRMESSATVDANGNKYTVHGYFYELFSGLNCEIVDSKYTADGYTAVYRKAFDAPAAPTSHDGAYLSGSRLEDISSYVDFTASYTQNPFVRKYVSVAPSPFNGVRAAYDSASPDATGTVIQRLKNGVFSRDGVTGERITFLPSIVEAFPYLRGFDPDGLRIDYVFDGSKRMDASGKKTVVDSDNAEYVFSRYFDTLDTDVTFSYSRPVPFGWYSVALLAGGIVFAAIVLATRPKKEKPTLLDRFPYNPEEYRDYESHLPM